MSYGKPMADRSCMNRLLSLRQKKNHSQSTVSIMTGLSIITISRIERNLFDTLKLSTIKKLNSYFKRYNEELFVNIN